MALVELDLFNVNRFPTGWRFVLMVLYAPFGLLLLILRLLLSLLIMALAAIMPQSLFVNSFIVRSMCFAMGIIVKQEGTVNRDPSVQLIVSNHISVLDHMALHVVSGCITVSLLELPAQVSRVLGIKDVDSQHGETALENEARQHIGRANSPLLCFPECATTSGRIGLLKFSPWPFRVVNRVQPVCLQTWRPPLADVALTVLGARHICDILWFMFVPFTVFTVRFLPVVEMPDDGIPNVVIQLVETNIAHSLGIKTTKFTASDKAEHEKRYLAELFRPVVVNSPSVAVGPNAELQRMSLQVKDVLPHVPTVVIYRDLAKTRSVDATITNILDGRVQFTPEPIPTPTTSTTSLPSKSSQNTSGTLNFFSQTSPQKRAMSFQEKKILMIETARKKYIEKHGIQLSTT